jgi:hypothetical protein
MKHFFASFVLLVCLFGCKTDFEVNAPYDKIPIVYGILDQSVDTQFIKINKSFLGTNNPAYSRINDSMYFDKVEVKIEELDDNGNVNNVYSLQSKYVPVAPGSGIFFTGQQKVYYFVPSSPLDESKRYRIVGNGDGKSFSATTNMIDDFAFASTFRNSLFLDLKLVSDVGVYNPIVPTWKQSPDAEYYDVAMRFHYTEHRNGNVYNKFIDWKIGSQKPTNFGDLKVESNTRSFFVFLSKNAQLIDTVGVTKRVIGNVDFRVTSSNLILKTYIDVNGPNNSISFDKPDYTNIEGGRGVFASRYTSALTNKKLSEKTIEELYIGQYTRDFKFCTDNVAYNTDPYYCP